MTEQGSVALNFHLNLNHRGMQPDQRERFLERDLTAAVECIEVPTTISACAEDLLIVRDASPQAWGAITENPNVYISPSLYSHALPELFPKEVVSSADLSTRITRAIVPEEKVVAFGYLPELSAPPRGTVEALSKIWQGTIFSDIRVQGHKSDEQPPTAFVSPEGLEYHAAVRKLGWRKMLQIFLRGMADTEETIDALRADVSARSTDEPLVAILDLETPLLNEIWDGSNKPGPSTALFAKLQRELKHSRLRFSVLGRNDDRGRLPDAEALSPADTAIDRWNHQELVRTVSAFACGTGYQRMLYLSSLCSDYFMLPEENLILPTLFDGVAGEMHMRNDGEARSHEVAAKIAALKVGEGLDRVISPGDDSFFQMTHRAIEQAVVLDESYRTNTSSGPPAVTRQ